MARETGSESPGDPLAAELRRWYLNARRQGTRTKVHAEGFALGDGFLVLRGSQAFAQEASGFSRPQDKIYRDLRARLVEAGHLERDGEVYRFTRDCAFASPSAAATVILARAASGPEEWRDRRGVKMAASPDICPVAIMLFPCDTPP